MPAETNGDTFPQGRDAKSVVVKVVGSLNWDIINTVEEHAPTGAHVRYEDGKELRTPGGHGVNQAVAVFRASHREAHDAGDATPHSFEAIRFRRGHCEVGETANGVVPYEHFSVDVHLIGTVGLSDDDKRGQRIKDKLVELGVNLEGVDATPGEATGYAHITIDHQGVPIIGTQAFANDKLSWDWVKDHLDHAPRAEMILVQLEIPMEVALNTIKYAEEKNIHIIFNAAPYPGTLRDVAGDSMFKVDHLILNNISAESFLRAHGQAAKYHSLQGFTRSQLQERYLPMCNEFHNKGAACVVITLGIRGAIGSYLEPKDANGGRTQRTFFLGAKRSQDADVVDETGASDAFIGAYAVEILRQIVGSDGAKRQTMTLNIEAAIDMGIKAGGLSLAIKGSVDSMPWYEQLTGPTPWLAVNPFLFEERESQ